MNVKNPLLPEIQKKGVSTNAFFRMFDQAAPVWGSLLQNNSSTRVTIYVADDEMIKTSVARFLQIKSLNADGIQILSNEQVIEAVRNNPSAIGFCNITGIVDLQNAALLPGLCLLPIDKNGNSRLDYSENIYGDYTQLMRGVWIGKFPRVLVNNIYLVGATVSNQEKENAFLNWVLTTGQNELNSNDKCALFKK